MKNYELRITNYELLFVKIFCVLCLLCGANYSNAQSTNQSFPTAVTTNEISGTIKARDIGDSRLTGYFYTFNAVQGDVFINVVTANFNGDIDVFTANGAKTLTKIVVYADSPSNETGRVIYLRKPEKLLLRVEGRSPNDDAATFRIKFAGSFQAAAANEDQPEEPKLPEAANAQNDSGIVVNSVGTIIAVKPKPTPAPKESVAENKVQTEPVKEISIETATEKEVVAEMPKTETNADGEKNEVKEISVETPTEKEVVAESPKTETAEKSEVKEITVETQTDTKVVADNQPKATDSGEKLEVSITETDTKTLELNIEKTETKPSSTKKPKTKKPVEPNPLENVRLIIVFKDGTKIERPMSEVSRVNVDNKGMLTVVAKDGTIGRYSILEVAKFTIE